VIKSLASALSIGSGAAVGREGPIIQIGSALGSAFSQVIGLSPWQRVTLLSAGAGAGIAATFIPKERHTNLYLVRRAEDIMERRFVVAEAGTTLRDAMLPEDIDDLSATVVVREGRIVGLIPPRSGLWLEARTNPDAAIEGYVETQLVICRNDDLLSLVFARLRRHRAGAATVFRGTSRPRVRDVVGITTKRAIADEVIHSYQD
jgi:hypothetical protein